MEKPLHSPVDLQVPVPAALFASREEQTDFAYRQGYILGKVTGAQSPYRDDNDLSDWWLNGATDSDEEQVNDEGHDIDAMQAEVADFLAAKGLLCEPGEQE